MSLASGISPFAELRASVNLAVLCQLTARGTEALEHLRRSEGAAAEIGAQVLQCHLMEAAAALLEICGRIEEAEAERAAAQARGLSIGLGSAAAVGNHTASGA